VAKAIRNETRPDTLTTVFAGQDVDAVQRARSYFIGYAPSSPQIALLKDGRVVFMLERHQIEGRTADDIAKDLVGAFDKYCEETTAA
jgi:putative YphP/YqiW family bacilliredoxin